MRHLRERCDGRGYPDGLEGEGIPIEARILAVADCYVVLTSDRPYRPRYERAEALEILRGSAGSRLDPEVVEKFLRVLPMLEAEVPEAAAAPAELQPVG